MTGHLDSFSKSLAGEVKTLMKEVGDLRESKRALQHEIADLLLIKARHGGGDGMNMFPWQGAAKVRESMCIHLRNVVTDLLTSLDLAVRSDSPSKGTTRGANCRSRSQSYSSSTRSSKSDSSSSPGR